MGENKESQNQLKFDKQQLKDMVAKGDNGMDEDIANVLISVNKFVDSKVEESDFELKSNYSKSIVHIHALSVLSALKAALTYDEEDISYAMEALKKDVEVSSYLRKSESTFSSITGMFHDKSKTFKSMTRLQKHAEITFAEAYLIKALLSLITESNMVTFVKEGLAIKQAYGIFKSFYGFLVELHKAEGVQGFKKNGIDKHFVTSIYLGIGAFNLMLSIVPKRLLKLFEFIGFSGNRDFGMQCLSIGAGWKFQPTTSESINNSKKIKTAVNFFCNEFPAETGVGPRKFICDIFLTLYNVLLSTMIQLPGCNFQLAATQVQKNLHEHPNSFLYLIFQGKISQAQRNLDDAISKLEYVATSQSDWRQLAHICYWDLGISYAANGQWEKAASYFEILYKDNKWSPAIYLYLRAVMLYTADKVKYRIEISTMMKTVPTLLKKVAGKSIPLEYFIQNEFLLLPAYEILYMWNGFDLIPEAQLSKLNGEVENILLELDQQQEKHKEKTGEEIPYSSFYDDLCLARFFKGITVREITIPSVKYLVPDEQTLEYEITPEQTRELQYASRQLSFISLQADEIEYDHWILPFARYELGNLFTRMKKFNEAKLEYEAALKGGYGETEAGTQKRKTSMESSLHIKIHNAIAKLKNLQLISSSRTGEFVVEDEGMESSESE